MFAASPQPGSAEELILASAVAVAVAVAGDAAAAEVAVAGGDLDEVVQEAVDRRDEQEEQVDAAVVAKERRMVDLFLLRS